MHSLLTLADALRLENSLKNLSISGEIISVRSYDKDLALRDIEEGIEDFDREIKYKLKLTELRFLIRRLVNESNMECGISGILNELDELGAKKDLLNSIGNYDTTERQLNMMETNEFNRISVVRKSLYDDVDQKICTISFRINVLKNKLTELNNTNVIKLSKGWADWMKDNNIDR